MQSLIFVGYAACVAQLGEGDIGYLWRCVRVLVVIFSVGLVFCCRVVVFVVFVVHIIFVVCFDLFALVACGLGVIFGSCFSYCL